MDEQAPHFAFMLRGDTTALRAYEAEIVAWNDGLAALLAGRGFPLRMHTDRPTAGAYAAAPWARAWRALRDGRVGTLGLSTYPPYSQDPTPDDGLSLTWWRGHTHAQVAEFELWARFGGSSRLEQAEVIRRCREIAERSGLSVGLLLCPDPRRGRSLRYSAVESAAVDRGVWFGPNALRRSTWGLGWAMWLTAGHLEVLGGRARVRRDAPAARILESPAGLWLEATASPWAMTEADWARLATFLAPILPTPDAVAALDPPRPLSCPQPPTAADSYADSAGPPAPHERLGEEGTTVAINVHLARRPPAPAARSLARALSAWYLAGVEEEDYAGGAWGSTFHYLRGPNWEGRVARWSLDYGGADIEAAFADLLRRLGGWSAHWGCPITVVRVGTEEP